MIPPGAFTGGIDLVEILLAAFCAFFAGLVVYLRREDKREGYPLEPTTAGRGYAILGWPAPPPPKTFRLMDGGLARTPHRVPQAPVTDVAPPRPGRAFAVESSHAEAGLGAGAFVMRSEVPMRTIDGDLLLKPLRNTPDWVVRRGEADPRGMRVIARDLRPAGTIVDLWVDRGARILRYLELRLDDGGIVLVPIYHCDISRRWREVGVASLTAAELARVPRPADPDVMTPREEDRINAFHAGGPVRSEAA